MIALSITGADTTGQQLSALGARLQRPADLLGVVGRDAVEQLKAHFRKRNTVGNKLGGRRTNFWSQIADSVQSRVEGTDSFKISVTDPAFVQKVYGGPIVPKEKKALAIPLTPEAYGNSPLVFPRPLVVIRWKTPRGDAIGALAEKGPAGQILVQYILTKRVVQSADPDALPDRDTFAAALVARATKYVERITADPSTTTSTTP